MDDNYFLQLGFQFAATYIEGQRTWNDVKAFAATLSECRTVCAEGTYHTFNPKACFWKGVNSAAFVRFSSAQPTTTQQGLLPLPNL